MADSRLNNYNTINNNSNNIHHSNGASAIQHSLNMLNITAVSTSNHLINLNKEIAHYTISSKITVKQTASRGLQERPCCLVVAGTFAHENVTAADEAIPS